MRLLIDGNIVLDVLQKREPHFEASANIWKLCETEYVQGYLSALTFANLVYVMRRELTPDRVNSVLEQMGLIFRFTDLNIADMKKAASMQWEDFEDAIQAVTAQRVQADYIITRNTKDYLLSAVPAVTPQQFLERVDI